MSSNKELPGEVWRKGLRDEDKVQNALERVAGARRSFAQGQRGAAHAAFRWGLEALVAALGDDVLREVYGENLMADAPLADQIDVLVQRLKLASQLFPDDRIDSVATLQAAAEEITAIQHGDEPRIFVRPPAKQGRWINAYRIAGRQLRALEWDAYLRGLGWTPAQRHNAVAMAFGATWTTIARWNKPIARELGDDRLQDAIGGSYDGTAVWTWIVELDGQLDIALKQDGEAYQAELRRGRKVA